MAEKSLYFVLCVDKVTGKHVKQFAQAYSEAQARLFICSRQLKKFNRIRYVPYRQGGDYAEL